MLIPRLTLSSLQYFSNSVGLACQLCNERFCVAVGKGYGRSVMSHYATSLNLSAHYVMQCTGCFAAAL